MADESDQPAHNLRSLQRNGGANEQADAFTFPQIPLEASFDSLLNNSHVLSSASQRTMRSGPPPRPPPSLSESWASLSDPELSQDDDLRSEHTDVGSLVDIRSVDDILSVQEDAATTEDEGDDETTDDVPLASGVSNALYHSQVEESAYLPTAGTSLTETSLLPTHITLEEHASTDAKAVSVRHVVKHFTRADPVVSSIDKASPCWDLVGAICMDLSLSSLRDRGMQSLHLLILGKDYLPSLRASIMGKVADALVASDSSFDTSRASSPSRYHIVPDCFGPGSVPSAAEVIPIDCQLEVDNYHSAEFLDRAHHKIQMREAHSSRSLESVRHKDGYVLNGEKVGKPDLAVIVVSDSDSGADAEQAHVMMIFAQRHSIPTIFISVDDAWGPDLLALSSTTPSVHRTIERSDASPGEPYRRLPLDLETFLQLDPAQLSRHLAHIIQYPQEQKETQQIRSLSEEHRAEGGNTSVKWSTLVNNLPNIQQLRNLGSRVPSWALAGLGAMLLVQVLVMLFLHGSNIRTHSLGHPSQEMTLVQSSTIAVSTQTGSSTAAFETVQPTHVPQLTIDATKSVAGSFEVEVVGDSHLIIRTPTKVKKKEPLAFTVSKGEETLEVKAAQLFPHVYSLYIPQEEMYGNLTIELVSGSSPKTDKVTINLGQRPPSVWLRGLLNKVENKLSELMIQFQKKHEEARLSRTQRHLAGKEPSVRAAAVRLAQKGEQLIRPLHSKIALLESQIQAWNHRIDVRGAELFRTTRANAAELLGRSKEQYEQAKQGNRLRKISLPSLPTIPAFENPIHALYGALSKLGIGRGLQEASQSLHDRTQSETLATAQSRAQQVVKLWRGKHREARRKNTE